LPGASIAIQQGLVGTLLLLTTGFVWAILTGRLEPRATADRIEQLLLRQHQDLKDAYIRSEEAREAAIQVSRDSLAAAQAALVVLEELRRFHDEEERERERQAEP
jgi:uncharacterized membrane protein (DUF2068 family)